jgi:hypothetical protein
MNDRMQRVARPVLDACYHGLCSQGSTPVGSRKFTSMLRSPTIAPSKACGPVSGIAQAKACGSGLFGSRFLGFIAPLMILPMFLMIGCHPWAHPGVRTPLKGEVTTPSWESAFAVEREPREARREFEERVRLTRDGSVTHGPLYFEDTSVILKTDSDDFGWTGDDFLYMYYGPLRFLVNMLFFPVSAVDTPPWCVMVSDGLPSREFLGTWHDSAKIERKRKSACSNKTSDAG